MLTDRGRLLGGAAVMLLTFGVVFGNWAVFLAGVLPLLLLAAASPATATVRATTSVSDVEVRRGDVVTVRVRVEPDHGGGLLEVHHGLPDEFELVDGSNYHVLDARTPANLTFRFRATRRGPSTLGPLSVRPLDPLGLRESPTVHMGAPVKVTVLPRALATPRLKGVRTRARDVRPHGDDARVGIPTTDFRDIREYSPGDPLRNVNWKATARRLGAIPNGLPLVNEFEREGQKSVWVLVDAGPHMDAGTSLASARDDAVDAALGFADRYLAKGYMVGVSVFGAPGDLRLPPDRGSQHADRVRKLLGRVPTRYATGGGLVQAVDGAKPYLHAETPLILVVTRLHPVAADPLLAGLRRARSLTHRRGRPGRNLIVLDVDPGRAYGADEDVADAAARSLVDADRRALAAKVEAVGARVARWDPDRRPLAALLAGGGHPR